ncbi:putative RNA-directed DNA polymerase [Arabidopsis thaliana]
MSKNFEMSDLGRLTYYLGIEVTQEEDGIILKQERYAKKILEEAGMNECKSILVPMISGLELSKALDEKSIDGQQYRRSIGCLRYMQDPRESHGAALKQVLRYLQGTTGYGLVFKKGDKTGLVGYSDASHSVDADDGKSTGGHVFYINECPISWCSQKQQVVALSSCEAEFMAATEAAK